MTILTNAKETGRYVVADQELFLGGAASGSQTINTALAQAYDTGTTNGLECEVTVRYIDQTYSTKWETMLASYDSASTSLTRISTVASSSGTSAISFDEVLDDTLIIYGTTSHQAFGVRTLQEDIVALTDTASTADSDTFINGTTGGATITPTSSASSLVVTYSSNLAVRRNGSSGTAVSGSYSAGYFNGSDTLVVIGDELEVALRGASATTDLEVETPVTKTVKLSQSNLDSSGDWKVSPMFNVANGNFRGDCINTTIHYREIL